MPIADEYRHLKRAAEVADEIAGGKFLQMCHTDGPEQKRIQELAGQLVKKEEARKSLSSSPGQQGFPHKKQVAFAGHVSSMN